VEGKAAGWRASVPSPCATADSTPGTCTNSSRGQGVTDAGGGRGLGPDITSSDTK
jgi:hypothetical protein